MRTLISKYWLPTFLAVLAFFLRAYSIERIPIIADVERDYSYARQMLLQGDIPLLGIPSSVPRFSQGPLNIWFAALAFLLGGINPYAPVLLSAYCTSAAVFFFFIWMRKYIGVWPALTSALLVALSPGGITQARMPFYLFAVPIFLGIYLFALLRLQNRFSSLVLAGLFFSLLFQWELATIPLIGLLIWQIWKQRINLVRSLFGVGSGMIVGLLPQLVYDVSHNCRHLCGFGVWMLYRFVAVTGFDGRHGYTWQKMKDLIGAIVYHLESLVGLGQGWFLGIVLLVSAFSLLSIRRNKLVELSWMAVGLLLVGLFIHGKPSEAYFPPFLILVPILFGFGFWKLKLIWKWVVVFFLCVAAYQSVQSTLSFISSLEKLSSWVLLF